MRGIIIIGFVLFATAALVFLFFFVPLNENSTSSAQSAYPPPATEAFINPYPTKNVAYPDPIASITPSIVPTDEPELASISIEISVDGLISGDLAQASLHSFTEDTEAQVKSMDEELPSIRLGNGEQSIHAEKIPIGVYKLTIQTSSEYFRNPKGFIVRVTEAGVALSPNQILHFNVVI
ncbi:hypothetical protein ACFLZW_01465 [Chloroflexota bacterium]